MKKNLFAFSIIELLTVITIIGMLIAIAFPKFTQYQADRHAQAVQNEVISLIQYAQQEALIKHVRVEMNLAPHKLHLSYAQGTPFFQRTLSPRSGVIYWRAFPHYRHYLVFHHQGYMRSDNATIWYCAAHQTRPTWILTLSKYGNIRQIVDKKVKERLGLRC